MRHDKPWKAIVAVLETRGLSPRIAKVIATEIQAALIDGLEESDNNIIFVLKDELTWGKIHEKENTP
jgi:hypothetical protein